MNLDYPEYPPRPEIPMKCGSCGGKLISIGPGSESYTHYGPMFDRHGSYPVEPWDGDDDPDIHARILARWESWRPPSWDYPPLPGVILNPIPPEPPKGSGVALYHRPNEVIYRRVSKAENGWRMPDWDKLHEGGRHIKSTNWRHIATLYVGHLVLVQE